MMIVAIGAKSLASKLSYFPLFLRRKPKKRWGMVRRRIGSNLPLEVMLLTVLEGVHLLLGRFDLHLVATHIVVKVYRN